MISAYAMGPGPGGGPGPSGGPGPGGDPGPAQNGQSVLEQSLGHGNAQSIVVRMSVTFWQEYFYD